MVSEWMTLDGVIDAGSMELWFNPYHSDAGGAYIKDCIDAGDTLVFDGQRMKCWHRTGLHCTTTKGVSLHG